MPPPPGGNLQTNTRTHAATPPHQSPRQAPRPRPQPRHQRRLPASPHPGQPPARHLKSKINLGQAAFDHDREACACPGGYRGGFFLDCVKRESLPGPACRYGVSNAALPVAVAGRAGVSNAALPVVVPTSSGRAPLLLPDGRNNNVARPDAVPAGQACRVAAPVQRVIRQPRTGGRCSVIMNQGVITEQACPDLGDVP